MSYRGKYAKPQPPRKNFKLVLIICFIVAFITATLCLISIIKTNQPEPTPIETQAPPTEPTVPPTEETIPPTTTPPETEPEPVIYTATVGAMGDLLMHAPVFSSQYSAEVYKSGNYDFSSIFQYIQKDVTELDYAVANLETTLAGTDNGYPYSGYPSFNCPDSLVDGVKNAGFDMLLTANNHSYDTNMTGYKRTISVIVENGLETLGTYATADATKWTVQNINNVNVGMLCYTYATDETNDGRPILNGGYAIKEKDLCNYFTYNNLSKFYTEVEGYLAEMEEAGADATMIFIHWGEEYQLKANSHQQKIAQKLCDMGIDVIVGGHPHVVQPIDLLESTTDPSHKTVCIYSTGNAISNQRQGAIDAIKTAHTEDGILFSITFEKQDDGDAYIVGVDALPTWANMFTNANKRREYNIIPLDIDEIDSWKENFDLSNESYKKAQASYERTMAIIGEGLSEVQQYADSNTTMDKESVLLSMARRAKGQN